MITKVGIENLRGIRSGELDGLAAVSVLVGPNNSGKSTCLEAIELASFGSNVGSAVKLFRRRGGSAFGALHHVTTGDAGRSNVRVDRHDGSATSWFDLTTNYTPDWYQVALQDRMNPPFIGARLGCQGSATSILLDTTGRLSTPFGSVMPGPFHARLVDVGAVRAERALEDAYSDIDRGGRLESVLGALQASMPGLVDLRILKTEDEFVLHMFMSDGTRVPAYLAGDGAKRMIELAAALAEVGTGVALLEDPECYQHPRYLRELVALIRFAASAGTQIILSTHSVELIDALLQAEWPPEAAYPSVHRLRLDAGQLRSTVLSREQALVAREELLEDLRA
jgi:hypothetical protein